MSILDMVLLFSAVVVALAALSARLPRSVKTAAFLALVGLAIAQLVLEGFYWHFTPAYVLIAMVGLSAMGKGQGKWLPRLATAALSLVALGAFVVLPAPQLPLPNGNYDVGTQTYRWIDESRDETAVSGQKRNVVVQIFYPVDKGVSGQTSPYMDGLGRLPASISGVPSLIMQHFDHINTHSIIDAPISQSRVNWPVVLFSPGYGASRSFYTSIISDLASNGYVVLAVDHPYEVAVAELADGSLATPVPLTANADGEWNDYMSAQQAVRVADMGFVIDQIEKPGTLPAEFADRLDLGHIGAIGHSFGGAAAVALAGVDARIKAVVNIDGTLYGDAADKKLTQPFMLLESDHAITGHSKRYLDGNQRLIDNLAADGYRYEIPNIGHFSFTDAPLYLAEPARWLLADYIGSRWAPQTHAIVGSTLSTFLHKPLALGTIMNFETFPEDIYEFRGGKVN